jgi:hypothetical protein
MFGLKINHLATLPRTVYDYSSGLEGVLELPVKIGSSCQFSPVRFLRDSKSVCPLRLTPEACADGKGSVLDYQAPILRITHSAIF